LSIDVERSGSSPEAHLARMVFRVRVRVRIRVLGLWLGLGLGHSRILARCASGLDPRGGLWLGLGLGHSRILARCVSGLDPRGGWLVLLIERSVGLSRTSLSSENNLCSSENCYLQFRLYCKVQQRLLTKLYNL